MTDDFEPPIQYGVWSGLSTADLHHNDQPLYSVPYLGAYPSGKMCTICLPRISEALCMMDAGLTLLSDIANSRS